jgi:hypothetical protein
VLEAEQRLLSSDLRGPHQGIAVATTPTNIPQRTTAPAVATANEPQQTTTLAVASDSLVVEVSNDTTNASSIAVGFKDILKNSISKLIEKIQGQASSTEIPAVIAKTTPRTSDKKQKDPELRFDFAESEGETFLDQLLRKLSVGRSAVEEEKSSSDDSDEDSLSKLKSSLFSLRAEEDSSVEDEEEDALTFLLPKKKPSAASVRAAKKSTAKAAESLEQRIKQLRAENQAAEKQITSILDKVKLSSSDEVTEEDGDLYELDLDDSISRGRGRKVGSISSSRNLIQEELNAAAKESEQLSADLEALLAELEGQ